MKRKSNILKLPLAIALGILLISVDSEHSFFRFLSFIGGLILIGSALMLFFSSASIIEKISINKSREKNAFSDKSIYVLSTIIFIVGLFSLVIEILNFQEVLRPIDFWKTYYPIGFLISILSIYFVLHLSNDVFRTSKYSFTIFWGLLIGISLLFISVCSFSNRVFSENISTTTQYQVISKKAVKQRKSSKLLYLATIKIEGKKTKDVVLTKELFESISQKDMLSIELKEGYLGFEIIIAVMKYKKD